MTEPIRLVQQGFSNIEIEKGKLLDIIKENKTKHIEEYNKSVKAFEIAKLGYAQEFWAQLSENIGLAKKAMEDKLELVADAVLNARDENTKEAGVIDLKNINASIAINLQPKVRMTVSAPVSHEKDYTVAIRGLELSTAEFVYLTQSDFSRYVLDEWEWKATFNQTNNVLWSGASMSDNTYFANNINGVYISGCSTTAFGSASHAEGTLCIASGVSSLGEKSSLLFNSIYNNAPEVK